MNFLGAGAVWAELGELDNQGRGLAAISWSRLPKAAMERHTWRPSPAAARLICFKVT